MRLFDWLFFPFYTPGPQSARECNVSLHLQNVETLPCPTHGTDLWPTTQGLCMKTFKNRKALSCVERKGRVVGERVVSGVATNLLGNLG